MMDYTLHNGDCLEVLRGMEAESVNCCVTSPPYWGLRDYGVPGQIGLEATPGEYVAKMIEVFGQVWRVLRGDGTLWLNLGDSYCAQPAGNKTPSGFSQTRPSRRKHGIGAETVDLPAKCFGRLKLKDLVGTPWRVALALQEDGWYLRNDIIWHKPACMSESVNDRCTRDHEYIFLLSKSRTYYFDQESIKVPASPDTHARYARGRSNNHKHADGGPGDQTIARGFDHIPGVNPKAAQNVAGSRQNASFSEAVKDVVATRNLRTVWSVSPKGFSGAHFAVFPPELIEPCVLAGCPKGGTVLDPFAGSGTTAGVAAYHGRKAVLIEASAEYCKMVPERVRQVVNALAGKPGPKPDTPGQMTMLEEKPLDSSEPGR